MTAAADWGDVGRRTPQYGRYFRDRVHAGTLLGERLAHYKGQNILVVGIPRGGVPVAAEVARQLDADLDIVVARKLGAPGAEELAIGAVTANGGSFLNEDIIRELRVSAAYLHLVTARERAEAHQREARFRGQNTPAPVAGRIVIVVDDGLATGATMRAAARSLRKQAPARLVVAVPVGSPEACTALRAEADEVVCMFAPDTFFAVGQFYEHFEPVADTHVQGILAEWCVARRAAEERSDSPEVA